MPRTEHDGAASLPRRVLLFLSVGQESILGRLRSSVPILNFS